MARMWRWIGLPAALLIFLGGPAGAKNGTKISILILDPQSAFMEAAPLAELGSMLRGQVGDYSQLALIKSPDIGRLHKLAGCHDDSNACLKALGQAVEAQQVLFSQIQKLPGRYMVMQKLIDTRSGKVIKTSRQRSSAGQAAALKALRAGWQTIFGRLVDSLLTIEANVSGARIYLDGRFVGEAPLAHKEKLTAGMHVLRAVHPDYVPATRKIRIRANKPQQRVRFNMVIKPSADIPPVALVTGRPGDKRGDDGGPGPGDKRKDDDGPGPGDKLKDDGGPGPGDKLKDDDGPGPGDKLKDDDGPGPGDKLKDDDGPDPGDKLKDDDGPGPGDKLKDDDGPDPGDKLKDDAPNPDGTRVAVTTLPPDDGQTKPPYLPDDGGGDDDSAAAGPVYRQWWFWTAIGAVVVAGVVTGAVLGTDDGGSDIPAGKGRLTVAF